MTCRFICVMGFIPKNSCMFNFIQTDAHICFTEHVMSIYCVKCIIVMSRKIHCRNLTYCEISTINIVFRGPKYKTHLNECIPEVWGGNWAFSVKVKTSPFLELKLAVQTSYLARRASKEIPLYLSTGKCFQDQKTRVFVSHFSNDTKEFQWNLKKNYINNDYLWNTSVYLDLFWFWGKNSPRLV